MTSFDHIAHNYSEGPPRQVPGLFALHRMSLLLLAEHVPADGRVLVLGAGGGMELSAFAEAQGGWTFDGVDPSAEMLDAARRATDAHASRINLHHGYIETAPEGPYHGATCLLTLHFMPREQRLATLKALRQRLRQGAPFIAAHMSYPQDAESRETWSRRHMAFAISNGFDPDQAERGRVAILSRLPILAPEDDEALLRQAGFGDVSLFYTAFGFRGWVAYAT